MISIITPFFNSKKYLSEAIKSVLKQSYEDWELILINDGSTDKSKEIALSFNDSRIKYFEQENKGVSAARNVGLSNMKGEFFCFLDSDDMLSIDSLKSRRLVFDSDASVRFVDGTVLKMDSNLQRVENVWRPSFRGNPLKDLVQLTGNSFFGPSWMIRRDFRKNYSLDETLRNSEDLFFYLSLAKDGGQYTYTDETILLYRNTPNSAMKNLEGLEAGYRYVENQIRNWKEVDKRLLGIYKYKFKKAMFLAYLRKFQPIKAIKSII